MNPTPEATITELRRVITRAEITIVLDAWAAATGPEATALVEEWRALCCAAGEKDEAVSLSVSDGPDGRLFVVACENGRHWSSESHLVAFRQLVEAHR